MTGFQTKARIEAQDLRARLNFCADTGQIMLHEQRMLLVHAEAQSSLRKELIETLGMSRARGLLLRMGYASGVRDAEFVQAQMPELDEVDAFLAGPRLHSFEGMVGVTPIRLEVDRDGGHFYGEFRWVNSWECQSHRRHFGPHCGSVCWTQIGYACGYSSTVMGRSILFKEVECAGGSSDSCRIVGRPVEEWDDADAHMRCFEPDPIADQLIELQTQVLQLRSTIGERESLNGDLNGSSPCFRHALDLLRQAAAGEAPVLLVGETGAGKELFARALHRMSARRERPLDVVNCAVIPPELVESELFGVEKGAHTGAFVSHPGHLERAEGSTIFLEEIGDLPLAAQAKLLRVVQKGELVRLGDDKVRKISVRIVAATTGDLARQVKEGRFRADLYYRLNAGQIYIPPLRERREDIQPLAQRLLERYATIKGKKLSGFTEKARKALTAHAWPGNVRELQNTIERGVILAPNGGRVDVDNLFLARVEGAQAQATDLDGEIDIGSSSAGRALCEAVCDGAMTLEEVEAMLVEVAMDKAHGNLSSAARMLGLTPPQLAERLRRL